MFSRRNFFKSSALAMASGTLLIHEKAEAKAKLNGKTPLKLGLVTYNLAKDWDIDTLIKNCTETKFEAVELRTTHAHGVEPGLTAEQRREVRKKFADSPVKLASLGSVCEFDSPDPQALQQNIETCKEFVQLAADVGAEGVKVRPNHLHLDKGIPEETTLKQIGESLALVGSFA
ncbi:sugar phosphate isomerase/epimerase, partial [bacterium]|nr:sugar phosphate isomerase/epimerase [bacterium]